ncbi:hypothetical protein E2562_034846 [Oryza meyeriana var. granulata]|uniref:VOC domain-containing protein n=1 Tax=Oryza meyeriana var. granulata TaxID=110450 RepID=A0A6G1E6J2_9ORYZ|nr:hypothetical protein E2562_034846 [Oryza meyeriana var. granulata]
MEAVQRRLKEMGVRYVQRRVEEGGIYVDQIFFHDPDGFMIEVCICDNLPVTKPNLGGCVGEVIDASNAAIVPAPAR